MTAHKPRPDDAYEVRTRPRRRMTPARRMMYRLAAPIGLGLIRLWWALLGRTRVIGAEHLAGAVREHGSVIPVYWHALQLLTVRHLISTAAGGLKLGFLISPSIDGELPAMLVERGGGHVIRGSSNMTGARALRDYYEAVVRRGISPAVTPDGPSGPRGEFKPGAILLSQLTGRPMLPMSWAASRVWRFPTWDRFALPLPFARVVLAIGEPQVVPKGLDAAALEDWQARMRQELEALHERAEAAL